MQKAGVIVALTLLGWIGVLHGVPVETEPLYPTQENFDLDKFMGKWHDVAVASQCPYIQKHKGDAAIGTLELDTGSTEGKINMKRTMLRGPTCVVITGDYEWTTTPGRFTYYVAKWGANVDTYILHTNYDEYAIVLAIRKKSSGEKSISLRLYSRTMDVRDTLVDDFRTLVKEQGMDESTIIIKKNKGECVPEEIVENPSTQPQTVRSKRSVLPSLSEVEGSGDSTPLFKGPESCNASPDAGPCFGMMSRFFYNTSSMSCQMFLFGGCMGNQNNFMTERECLQSCRTEAVCHLPMVALPCTNSLPMWTFDSNTGLCLPYKQNFCQANSNKFYSKAECEEYCGVIKNDEELLDSN